MEKNSEHKVFTRMNENERKTFDNMMSEMRSAMSAVRMDSVRMSREAQHAASMAYLNC